MQVGGGNKRRIDYAQYKSLEVKGLTLISLIMIHYPYREKSVRAEGTATTLRRSYVGASSSRVRLATPAGPSQRITRVSLPPSSPPSPRVNPDLAYYDTPIPIEKIYPWHMYISIYLYAYIYIRMDVHLYTYAYIHEHADAQYQSRHQYRFR